MLDEIRFDKLSGLIPSQRNTFEHESKEAAAQSKVVLLITSLDILIVLLIIRTRIVTN